MKCSLGISNFLEEISSLSHCVVFLYFWLYLNVKEKKKFDELLIASKVSALVTIICKASKEKMGLVPIWSPTNPLFLWLAYC